MLHCLQEAELEMSMSGVQTRAAQQQAELMGQINLTLHGKQQKVVVIDDAIQIYTF